jgi:hypothetical protein
MSHWTVYTQIVCHADLGVVYSSIESATGGALEDLDLAERMLIQNVTGSEDKGTMSHFISD